VAELRKTLKNDFDLVVADGQGQLKGKIFRMGHLGFVSERDMIAAVGSLEMALDKLGYKFNRGAGTEALIRTMMEL